MRHNKLYTLLHMVTKPSPVLACCLAITFKGMMPLHMTEPGRVSTGYGGYYGSSGYASGYGSGYSPSTYGGGYGSSPAAPSGGYYSATPSTLFGSGRSLLSIMADEPVLSQPAGVDHFGSTFPSNAWQFVHHNSPSGVASARCA